MNYRFLKGASFGVALAGVGIMLSSCNTTGVNNGTGCVRRDAVNATTEKITNPCKNVKVNIIWSGDRGSYGEFVLGPGESRLVTIKPGENTAGEAKPVKG